MLVVVTSAVVIEESQVVHTRGGEENYEGEEFGGVVQHLQGLNWEERLFYTILFDSNGLTSVDDLRAAYDYHVDYDQFDIL